MSWTLIFFYVMRWGKLHGAHVTHVDDLLVAAPLSEMGQLQQGLSRIFTVAEWEADLFEYAGATIKQENDTIELHQTSYINARLETVDIPKDAVAENLANQVTKQDNMSTIGLSPRWFPKRSLIYRLEFLWHNAVKRNQRTMMLKTQTSW